MFCYQGFFFLICWKPCGSLKMNTHSVKNDWLDVLFLPVGFDHQQLNESYISMSTQQNTFLLYGGNHVYLSINPSAWIYGIPCTQMSHLLFCILMYLGKANYHPVLFLFNRVDKSGESMELRVDKSTVNCERGYQFSRCWRNPSGCFRYKLNWKWNEMHESV